jgi:hypothetical protein
LISMSATAVSFLAQKEGEINLQTPASWAAQQVQG